MLAGSPRPFARALGLVAVVLFGAWLGLLAVGSVRTPVGPMDTTMTLRPSLSGGTKINVSPSVPSNWTRTTPRSGSTSTSTASTRSAPRPWSSTPNGSPVWRAR